MLDDIPQSNLRVIDVTRLANFVLRDICAVLLSKLWTIRRSNDHVQNLELVLEVYKLMKSPTLGAVLVVTLRRLK